MEEQKTKDFGTGGVKDVLGFLMQGANVDSDNKIGPWADLPQADELRQRMKSVAGAKVAKPFDTADGQNPA